MGIGWFSVLQAVPWAEVIRNAPKVADGARKLWSSVNKKSAAPVGGERSVPSFNDPHDVAALEARLAAMEAAASELHAQMQASSDLIKTLAEQNALLVKRVDALRTWSLWLAGVAVVSLIAALAGLMLAR